MKLNKLKPFIYCTIAAVLFSVLRIYDPYPIEILRLKGLDYYQKSQNIKTSDLFTIIEIDESSLEKYGQWPWKRDVLSHYIKKAYYNGAGLVVLPILFAEEDRLGGDKTFTDILYHYPVVTAQSAALQGKGKLVKQNITTIGSVKLNDWLFDYPNGIGPIESVGTFSKGVGMTVTAPELDGVVRRMPLMIQVKDEVYPTLPLEILRTLVGDKSYQVKVDHAGVNAIRLRNVGTFETDENARVWINYDTEFNKISLTSEDWSSVKDTIAVIALTAEGLSNSVATPIKVSNGHELNLQVVETLANENILVRPVEATLYEILFTLTLSLLLTLCALKFLWVINSLLISLVVVTLPIYGFWLFSNYNLLYDFTYPIYSTFLVFTLAIFFRFIHEYKGKMLIKKQFEHYLAPEIVKKLQKNPNMLKLGGDTQDLTILFSDIRGFTTISEQFKDNPQGLTYLINRYLTPMTQIVMESGGTIDKYIGDALMAFWNAPIPEDKTSHRIKAIEVAIKMQLELSKLNIQLIEEGKKPLAIGIGINTGRVVVGNMGSEQRFDYTCLGDGVNLAARLEGQTKSYGVGILLGQETTKLIGNKFKFIELDKIAVKGKKEGIKVYTVIDGKFDYLQHDLFLKLYKERKWLEANKLLNKCIKINPILEYYYNMMKERVADLKVNDPGEGWDQVYRAKSK
jgi:adenylate cyclase